MRGPDKISVSDVLSVLWKKKYVVLATALIVIFGGIIFTKYFLADQSTLQIRYEQVGEADYKIHRNLYVASFFSDFYQMDRSITRMNDEEIIDALLDGIDELPPGVSITRSGKTVRISVRSKKPARHAELLKEGLVKYTAAVNRYRLDRINKSIDGTTERIDYDVIYRLGEIEHLEKYKALQGEELSKETFSEELTRLYIQLSQLDYARDEMTVLRTNLPDMLKRFDLVYLNKVHYATPTPLNRTKIIVFAVAGFFAGAIIVIIADFIRAGMAARKNRL